MATFVIHILEYITVKTSFFIIENTISIGYYIGSSAANYIYSTVVNKKKNKGDNYNSADADEKNGDIDMDELKREVIQLRSKVDELEKKIHD